MALTLTIMFALLALASANTKLIMNVTHHTDDDAKLDWVTVRCSVEAGMDTLERLTLSSSGANGTTEELARIDSTSAQPIVAPEITDFQATGSTDQKFLELSWKDPNYQYRHSYRCVASGIDEKAEQVVLSDIKYFGVQVNRQQIQFDLTKFEVSNVNTDRVYLASRNMITCSLDTVNNECIYAGKDLGYLVELNDQKESKVVFDFAKTVSFGADEDYMTGANDVEQPDTFVYYHSNRSVPDHVWLPTQPDNLGGNEQCTQLKALGSGLNDTACGISSKYMCEILLRRK